MLKLIPLPANRIDLLIPFDSIEIAVSTITEIMKNKKITPSTVEFLIKDTTKACEQFLKKDFPFSDSEAQLLIQLDGNDPEQLVRVQRAKCGQVF